MLARFGLSNDRYDSRIDDGLQLKGAIIVNSVKCLPPQNKPTPAEIRACRPFFEAQLAALPSVRVIIALGRIAHDAALRAAGARLEIGRAQVRTPVTNAQLVCRIL